jgi:hypothetical protein
LQEHGEYIVDRCGQIILFAGRGPWNDQTLRRGTQEMGSMIQAIDKNNPWAQLSYLTGESLMPPSTFNSFAKQTKIRKTLGLTGLAIVIQHSEISSTIRRQLGNAYQQADIAHAFLDSMAEGVTWLAERGFMLPADKLDVFCDRCSFIKY